MKRIKHSKFKNTGLIFELLVRQVASDTMHNRDSVALQLIKKHFSKSAELANELKLYRAVQEEKFVNERKAELFLDAIVKARRALNETKLRREKYNLVKDIRNRLNVDEFFHARISTYKQHAAAYKLFEYSEADDPRTYIDSKYLLIEYVQTQQKVETKPQLASQDKDIRILASKLIIDKFNEKYSNLNNSQKSMLREYINNITNTVNLKQHVIQETKKIESELQQLKANIGNKITRIKLNEVISLLKELRNKHVIQDKDIVTMLRYYELVSELKTLNKG
jgi:hypothetical protein